MKMLALVLMMLLVGVFPVQMQEVEPVPLVVANAYTFDLSSTSTGKGYRISVALPASYETSGDRIYPVMYILDPLTMFLGAAEMVRFLHWANELPEVIVVGIGYPTDDLTETLSPREQDYHFRQGNFVDFIEGELFPQVETDYRIDTSDRALVGFSYGGELVYFTLAERAALFSRYIAVDADASAVMPFLTRENETFASQFLDHPVRLFIAASGNEFYSRAFETRAYEGITVKGVSLGNVTHAQTLPLSLPQGIMWIYAE